MYRPVWSESSLCASWVAKDPSFLHAGSEDSDQTGRMPRLNWVFAGCTCHFAGFVTRRLKCSLFIDAEEFSDQMFSMPFYSRPVWSNVIKLINFHISTKQTSTEYSVIDIVFLALIPNESYNTTSKYIYIYIYFFFFFFFFSEGNSVGINQ